METQYIIILVLVALVAMSAYFSATETAFSTFNRIRIKNMAAQGDKRAALVLHLSEDYDRLLSTILIGNNIVNIASASLATIIFTQAFGDMGVTLSTVVMTVVVLIFGEISPTSLAKDHPERFSMFSAPALRICCVVLKPLNFLFAQWKKLLGRLFKSGNDAGVTEEELLTLVEEAQQEGGIDTQAGELIRSAIEFDDLDAVDICTPRTEIAGIADTATPEEIMSAFMDNTYSRLPVYHEDLDHIIGVLHQRDFFKLILREHQPLTDVLYTVPFIPPTVKISQLLQQLQQSKSHMAIVLDEYGGTLGLITLEDIIEELVGEIWDEHDQVVQDFEPLGGDNYRVLGSADVDDLFELAGLDEEVEFNSVNGWIADYLGRIPRVGDTFQYQNLDVSVLKADGRRVLEAKVHIGPQAAPQTED